jgi:KUP system potassium uptake protein
MRYLFIPFSTFNNAAVTLGFQTTANIGNAYGICVVTVFSITTHLAAVVMLLVWRAHPALSAAFYVVFGLIEIEFLYSSILSKFAEGGYLPFCLSLVLMALMVAWH